MFLIIGENDIVLILYLIWYVVCKFDCVKINVENKKF